MSEELSTIVILLSDTDEDATAAVAVAGGVVGSAGTLRFATFVVVAPARRVASLSLLYVGRSRSA